MSGRSVSEVDQAVAKYVGDGWLVLAYWSSEWYTAEPWTYEGQKIGYFCKRRIDQDGAQMTTTFIGPLAVVYFRKSS